MPDGTAYFCVARTIRKSYGYASGDALMAVGIGCPVNDARKLVYADGYDLDNIDAAVPIGTTCRLCERARLRTTRLPPLQHGLKVDENVRGRSFYAPVDGAVMKVEEKNGLGSRVGSRQMRFAAVGRRSTRHALRVYLLPTPFTCETDTAALFESRRAPAIRPRRRLRDLDRFQGGVAEGDDAVVGAWRLENILDLICLAAKLSHGFASDARDSVSEMVMHGTTASAVPPWRSVGRGSRRSAVEGDGGATVGSLYCRPPDCRPLSGPVRPRPPACSTGRTPPSAPRRCRAPGGLRSASARASSRPGRPSSARSTATTGDSRRSTRGRAASPRGRCRRTR